MKLSLLKLASKKKKNIKGQRGNFDSSTTLIALNKHIFRTYQTLDQQYDSDYDSWCVTGLWLYVNDIYNHNLILSKLSKQGNGNSLFT